MPDQNNIIVGGATISVDGSDLGFTSGGVSWRHANDFFDVEADQLAGVARKAITFQRMFVTTILLEATLLNLRQAMGEPASQLFGAGTALALGQASPVVTEHTIVIRGNSPSGTTQRTLTLTRCVAVEEMEHVAGARDAASVVPIGFECMKDPAAGNTFGFITDV